LLKRMPEGGSEVETATRALLVAIEELLAWRSEHDLDVLFEASEA